MHSRQGDETHTVENERAQVTLDRLAHETLAILDRGWYETAAGRVSVADAQQHAVGGTVLYRPADLAELACRKHPPTHRAATRYSVTQETTQEAACRLVADAGVRDLALLNFASARKVGGGFLWGARAQEEDIARSSGLVRCLETQPEYYQQNQAMSSYLYTDNIIYSPSVPWFRSSNGHLLDEPFLASIISAPAPNAREYRKQGAGAPRLLRETLNRRAAYILEVAISNENRSLLLGAWGCGVFGNAPQDVAVAFISHLRSRRFRGCFEHVVFAVFDQTETQETYAAFRSRIK